MKWRNGNRTEDLALYVEWAKRHSIEQRTAAARAAFCLLWGGDWDATPQRGALSLAVDRLLAFSGDIPAERVAIDWKLIDWHDVDGGSTELVIAAKAFMRNAFRPFNSPSGTRFWSNTLSFARITITGMPIDYPARTIVASTALDEIEQTLGRPKMITFDQLAYNPALRVTVATGAARWQEFLAQFPIEQAGPFVVDIVRFGEEHPKYGEALSDLLTYGRVQDDAGDLWGIIDLWDVADGDASIILERY
jgi:hypothetical protein